MCEYLILALRHYLEAGVGKIAVNHKPKNSVRYLRASSSIYELLTNGRPLGYKRVQEDEYEFAVFAAATHQEIRQATPGRYGAFRVFLYEDDGSQEIDFAEQFAFYDNEDSPSDSGNRAFYSLEEAESWMLSLGYTKC